LPSLFVTMWRRFLPRTYVNLRAIGRFLRTWLFAPTGRFSSVLYACEGIESTPNNAAFINQRQLRLI